MLVKRILPGSLKGPLRKSNYELAAQYQGLIQNRLNRGASQDFGILAQYGLEEASLQTPRDQLRDQVRAELKQLSGKEISDIMLRRKTHAKYLEAYDKRFAAERKQLIEILKKRHEFFSNHPKLILNVGMDFETLLDSQTKELLNKAQSKLCFLGRGSHGEVYYNAQEHYNIKIPYEYHDDPDSAKYFLREADSLVDGQGLPCIKKLLAYSAKDTAIVTEFVDGHSYEDLDATNLNLISPKELSDLVETIEGMHDKGYSLDISSTDIFYTAGKGFTFIDNGIEPDRSKEMSLLFLLYVFLVQPLAEASSNPSPDLMKARIDVTQKLLKLIKEKYPSFVNDIQKEIEEKMQEWNRLNRIPINDENISVVSKMPWLDKDDMNSVYPSLKDDIESLFELSNGILI